MRGFIAILAGILTVSLSDLQSQGLPLLEPGTRVRVASAGLGIKGRSGTLRRLGPDSVVIRFEYGAPDRLAIPLSSLTSIEVSRGRTTHTFRGAGIGLLIGALGGVAVTALLPKPDDGCSVVEYGVCYGSDPVPTELIALYVGALGGLGGAVFGGIVGGLASSERWELLTLEGPVGSFPPSSQRRFALGVKVRF